jgi:hypothetical protein
MYLANFEGFGYRELDMAAKLLSAYSNNPQQCSPWFIHGNVRVVMNINSGCVYLLDEDENCAMMNGDKLEPFISTPCVEGFFDDVLTENSFDSMNEEDVECIENWAKTLNKVSEFEAWSRRIGQS